MLTIALFGLLTSFIFSQTNADRVTELNEEAADGDSLWTIGAGFGLDISQLMQLNPKVGAGDNRIGVGAVGTIIANYRNDRTLWTNNLSILYAIQRTGAGKTTLDPGSDENEPFEKSIDEVRLTSNYGFQTKENSNWYYSGDFTLLTQLTPSYLGNYLSPAVAGDMPTSKFMSPGIITLAPGLKYVPNDNFSLFLSPISSRMIIVSSDDIAAIPGFPENERGLHGNPWRSETDFDNMDYQFGASIAAIYQKKVANDRLAILSDLILYTDYLDSPFTHTAVDWRNELAFNIWKGLMLSFNLNLFYDHNIPVQITDLDEAGGLKIDPNTGEVVLGRRINLTQTLQLKYNHVF